MSELNHGALVHLLAESNRHVPINPNDPAIAALIDKLQAARLEVTIAADNATQKSIAVQAAIAMVLPFAGIDESDSRVAPLVSALRTARNEANAALELTLTKMQDVLDIIASIEKTARNSCPRFN